MNIRPTKLFKMKSDLPHEEAVIVLAAGIKQGEVLYCHGNRLSSLGGYIGDFSQTYQSPAGLFHPTDKYWANMPMRYFEPIE